MNGDEIVLILMLTETKASKFGERTESKSPSLILIERLARYPLFLDMMITS